MRAVVDTQWFVVMPTITNVPMCMARKSSSRLVPMKALLNALRYTLSPSSGCVSRLGALPGFPRRKGLCSSGES